MVNKNFEDVLLCKSDGRFAQWYEGKMYCIYVPTEECKYRMSFKNSKGVLDYLCTKWSKDDKPELFNV